jgi:HemY protein
VRQFLAMAVRAPRDPAWVADGFASERWAPVSPVTGRLDAFEWRVPVERLGQLIEQDMPEHPSLALTARPEPEEPATMAEDTQDVVDAEPVAEPAGQPETVKPEPETDAVRMPDDPGVDPDREQDQPDRRFRLF